MRGHAPAALLLGLLLATSRAAAQETPGRTVDVYLDDVVHLESLSDEASGKAFGLLGRVSVRVPGLMRILARRMVVWIDPRAEATALDLVEGLRAENRRIPLWALRAIYAEGGRAPATFHAGGRVFRCSSAYYDFDTLRGILLDADVRLPRRLPDGAPADELGELPDFVVRARRLHALKPGEWRGEDVVLASSDYHEPQVRIHVERLRLVDEHAAEAVGELMRVRARARDEGVGVDERELEGIVDALRESALSAEGKSLDLEQITVLALSAPLLRWPGAHVDEDVPLNLRVEAEAGGRGSLGTGGRLGVGVASRPVGFMVGGGYYDGRGPLFDLEIPVDAWDGRVRGNSFGVYLRDHGDDYGLEPPTRNRYWTKHQYRWRISDAWRLDAEYADLSDPVWLRVYDEREYKEGKPQETLLHLRRRGEVGYLHLTGKWQTIEFEETAEELPTFAASLPALTLLRLGEGRRGEPVTLQLAADAELADLRLARAEDDPRPSLSAARFHTDPTLYVNFDAGPVRLVPFGTFGFTAYEQTFGGDSLARFAGTAGMRGDIQLSRWCGRRREVLNLSVAYEDLYTVSESASSLFPIDDIDRVTPYERLTARARQRFLRRTPHGPEEYLSVELMGAWFPGGQRPLGETGEGYVELDVEWKKPKHAALSARVSVDAEEGRVDTGALSGWWRPRARLRLGGEYRHLEGDSDIVAAHAEVLVETRWRLVVFSQFELREGDALDQGILVQRLGQTAVVGVRFAYDPGDYGFQVSLKVDLLERFRRHAREREEDYRGEIMWR